MVRKPVFAANWKMNHGPTDARAFLRAFLAHYSRHTDRTVAFFPPALTLHAVTEALRDRSDVLAGSEYHWEPKGAFTGAVRANRPRRGRAPRPRWPFGRRHISASRMSRSG